MGERRKNEKKMGEKKMGERRKNESSKEKECAQRSTLQQHIKEGQLNMADLKRQVQVPHPQQLQHQQRPTSVTDALQQCQMAATHAKEARPTKKFAAGTPFEYRNVIARFKQAVNNVRLDERMKLLEMSHWFSGNAGGVVDCYLAHKDAGIGYATARSQLDALYGATCDSVVPRPWCGR